MIRILSKNVADKIAAGEVVERPASIIKELVENSIDSGADSIIVEIKNGGKTYIRVTDDGCGMMAEEVETAFLRHATSKIQTADDLNSIITLGFRGEALASIAAVTRTEMITKTHISKTGVRVLLHGGELLSKDSIGCPDGTTMIITDLFYNTPARQKFLKSDASESGQIIDFMSQIALAYTDIRFRLINNGNIVFSTSGKGNLQTAIMAVYQQNDYKDLVPVDYSQDDNIVIGCISKPSLTKTTRRSQFFYVNGRVINSRVMEKGVSEGYKERLFDGRYPIAFLFLHTNPENLDVNIHPNKKEVRFDHENEIISLIESAIKDTLASKEAVIDVKDQFKLEKTEPAFREPIIDKPAIQVDIKQILLTKREGSKIAEDVTDYVPMNDLIQRPTLKPFDFDELTLTGSIFGTYITATDEKNFYLIDQHAAHERVFYEKLVGEHLNQEQVCQPILTPIVLEVSLSVKENEYNWLDSLSKMGFLIEELGPNSYVIREIPTFMEISEAEEFAKVYIENMSDGTNLNNTVVMNKLIMKSCKSAVKAHDYLSINEIEVLINQLKKCINPFSCPHGRPTFIKMSNYEIEKMFKRV